MSIADRIILALYTIMMAVVSALIVCFVARVFPVEVLHEHLNTIPGSWEFAVGGVVMFLVSIRLLIAGITRGGPKDITVHIGDGGVVRVSMSAVDKFVEKTAAQVRGVHTVKARISTSGDFLKVKMVAGVLPEANIPEISVLLRDKVKAGVKETVGREVSEVETLFNTIAYEASNKQRY